jgi:hypothetical protein
MTTAGWYPDPTGRHQHRYYDGTQWTDQAADAGVTVVDPLEPAPTSVAPQSGEPAPQGAPTSAAPTPPGPVVEPEAAGRRRGWVIGAIVGAALLLVLVIVGVVALASGGGDDESTGSSSNGTATTAEPGSSAARAAAESLPGMTQQLTLGISDVQAAAQREITSFNQIVDCANNALSAQPQDIDGLIGCFDTLDAFQAGAEAETGAVSALAATLSEADKAVQTAQSDPNAGAAVTSAVASATPTVEKARRVVDVGTQLCDCDGRLVAVLTRLRDAAVARNASGFNAAVTELNTEKTTRNGLYTQLVTI